MNWPNTRDRSNHLITISSGKELRTKSWMIYCRRRPPQFISLQRDSLGKPFVYVCCCLMNGGMTRLDRYPLANGTKPRRPPHVPRLLPVYHRLYTRGADKLCSWI